MKNKKKKKKKKKADLPTLICFGMKQLTHQGCFTLNYLYAA